MYEYDQKSFWVKKCLKLFYGKEKKKVIKKSLRKTYVRISYTC